MSIYQNDYFILPKKGNYHLFEGMKLDMFQDDNYFDDDLFWVGLNVNFAEVDSYISNFINEGNSWSENLKIYGNNDENCLKILKNNNLVESISFRLNFKTSYFNFIDIVVKFCKKFNFLIIDNDLKVLELESKIIIENLKNSRAFKRFIDFS